MLSGLPVDPQLQIINLLNSEINVSELFTSRCDDEIFWPTGTLELPPLPKEFQFISSQHKNREEFFPMGNREQGTGR